MDNKLDSFQDIKDDGACLPCHKPSSCHSGFDPKSRLTNKPTRLNFNLIKHSFLAGCYYKDKLPGIAEEYLWERFQEVLLKEEQEKNNS